MALTVSLDDIVASGNSLLAIKPQWQRVRLGDVGQVLNGYAFKAELFTREGGMPLIRIRDVGSAASETFYSGEFDERYVVSAGDLLVGMDGDFNCARWCGPRSLLNQRVCKITVDEALYLPRFLDYVLPGYLKAINDATSSITVKHLSSRTIQDIPLPLPPMDEQREIVAELEKQFSRLDEAVANLQRVKANLKRYKASVLKAAVEGRLVETEATLAHREGRTYETGEQLLKRILDERRANWKGRGKFSEPDTPIATETFPIPDGWCISAIPQIATIVSGNTPAGILDLVKPEGDIPWFKVGDMNHEHNKHSMTHADAWLTHQQVENLGLRVFPPKTVIFPKRGGAIATNKKRLLRSFGACDLNVMGITPSDEVAPYFFLWFESIDLAKLSDGSNVPQINNKDIVPLIVPLPPLAEQERIFAEVDRHLSIIREVEAEVDTNLQRAQALRQATLAKAFANPQQTNTFHSS